VGIRSVLAGGRSDAALTLLFLSLLLSADGAPHGAQALSTAPPQAHLPSGEIMALWRELREWRPRSGLVAPVSGLVLTRDAAEFHLDDGTLTLLEIRGRTAAAVFDGTGRVRIEPPLAVERKQLERHLGWDDFEVAVDRLFFLFADSTAAELQTVTSFTAGPASDAVRDATRDAVELLVGRDEGDIEWNLVRTFLNGEPTDLFRAHIFPRRGDDLYFAYDASSREEVQFGRKADRGNYFEALTSFHVREAYDSTGNLVGPRWATRPVDAMSYVAEVSIQGLDDFAAHVRAMLVPNVSGGSWLGSTLFHSLEVDSLQWGDGSAVEYDRSEDQVSTLWIRLPHDASAGIPLALDVWYQGEILERDDMGFYFLRTSSGWLPQFPGSEPTYDLTFRSRKDWPVMSVGERVSREIDSDDADIVVTRWVTSRPSSQVTFSVGDFEEYEFAEEGSPPIRVHVAEEFHSRFQDLASRAADNTGGRVLILSQRDPEEKVHLDIRNSLLFFSRVFGPLPFEEYNVAEIPFSHGQAFPGMINLSWLTFQWTSENGLDELFRAHEVAHQWWGIGTRPATYHDTWLSEGLSEFSALWYMHRVRANTQRYLDRLEDFQESILDRREEAGPIWLGPRLAIGRDGSEDYTVTVYSKGAWVIHMLRNLMLDHDTGGEELFDGFMKALFERFQGRTISTGEFRALLEAYLETDMGWFFDQWVYGTDIPTYRFAYTTEEQPDGVRMRVRIRQEDVPEDFMMPVPILLDFGTDGTAVVPVLVRGREVVTDLPILPRVPDEVTFNVLHSVLAEVHTEKW
jgi:hypothetical protein